MQTILYRRAVRNFLKNWPRYLALMGLILFSFFIVICMTSSAETVITGTQRLAEQDKVEDGEFSAFVPLTAREEEQLREKGIALEKMFSADYPVLQETTLRLFKVRRDINRLRPVTGRLPEGEDEIALERRYSEANGLQPGDRLTVAGRSFAICGIVTTPDYEGPFQTLGDSTIDSKTFGTGFVSDGAYEALMCTGKALQAEDYVYAYRLNGAMTQEELKEKLQDLPFDPSQVRDPCFQEYWARSFGRGQEITRGMDDFSGGLQALSQGMAALSEAAGQIPYAPGFMVFMEIGEARDLLGAQEDYFNMVLSDGPLDIPSGKLYNTLNREGMLSASHIFLKFMKPFITVLLSGALVVFVIVMFLMLRVMVDRSARSIALLQVFGYKTREIRKLCLDGSFLAAAVGSALALPLAKAVMDHIYPYFISNVACAVYLTYPRYFYILIWAATLALYLLINRVLMGRIRRITPADALANRE